MADPHGDPERDLAGLTLEEQVEDLGVSKKPSESTHKLDTDEKVQRQFRMVKNWWYYERQRQIDERVERMKAHDFYDGDQWDPEDAEEVEDRGQAASVFNMIKPSVDWILGTEKRTRVDYSVLPRKKEGSQGAEKKTKLLKYLSDVNKIGFERSLAFADAVISGLGWLDHGIRSDESDEPLFVSYEDWRNVWRDSHGKKKDTTDWRYIIRSKVVDYDMAVAMFPDRADVVRLALNQQDSSYLLDEQGIDPEIDSLEQEYGVSPMYFNQRDRVRLVACEFKVPTRTQVIRGDGLGTLNGKAYDAQNEGMKYLVENQHASLYDAVRMIFWKMIFCGNHVLQNGPRPYNHQRFSLVPVWGYIKKRDNRPYGVVKNLIDPQDDLNKRRSKALYVLCTKQAIVEVGAVDDIDTFIEEKDRPDGVMEVNRLAGVDLSSDNTLAAEHISLMDQDARYIENIGGVADESRGMQTNAISGKAIEARDRGSHVSNADLFDNYRLGFQLSGEIQTSLTEQYYTEEKTFRITGERSKPEFDSINTGPEDDITQEQADFIIEADAYHATIRQAMYENLGAMLVKLDPMIALKFLDIWFDLSDLPQRQVLVDRARSISGMVDPDADMNDPQVRAELEKRMKQQAFEEATKKRLMELEVQLKEAEVQVKEAKTAKDRADARKKIADIKNDIEETRIKKAEVLEKIEARETAPDKPRPAASLTG
jgi:hypothetical protein